MKISPNEYQMFVYNPEIWPENPLYFAKSDCTGFTITSGIAMITLVWYLDSSRPVMRLLGGGFTYTHILPNKADVRL